MKAFAVIGFLLGVMAMLSFAMRHDAPDDGAVVALNYAVYRNAAFLHVLKTKPTGVVPDANLDLPHGWVALRAWQTRVESEHCYVFGQASAQEVEAVKKVFQGSFAIGRVERGLFLSGDGRTVPVPAFVPHNSLLSVIKVD